MEQVTKLKEQAAKVLEKQNVPFSTSAGNNLTEYIMKVRKACGMHWWNDNGDNAVEKHSNVIYKNYLDNVAAEDCAEILMQIEDDEFAAHIDAIRVWETKDKDKHLMEVVHQINDEMYFHYFLETTESEKGGFNVKHDFHEGIAPVELTERLEEVTELKDKATSFLAMGYHLHHIFDHIHDIGEALAHKLVMGLAEEHFNRINPLIREVRN